MPRIVSLIASATEIVSALGFEEHLVGRSHECDFPPSVKRLPVCTAPRFDTEGSSQEIDERVKSLLSEGQSIYQVDGNLLRELRPDIILTQAQCAVCAVTPHEIAHAIDGVVEPLPRIVALKAATLDEVWIDIQTVADALDAAEQGASLIASLRERITAIAVRSLTQPDRPTIACIEWIEPLMACGNWVPQLVDIAGGINAFGQAGKHSPWLTWEQLVQRNPDRIVIMPCGYDLRQTRQNLDVLTQRPEWPRLQAARMGEAFLADGNQYFNRPGPRLVESLEILAELLHPRTFHFGHEGTGWQRL